MTIEPYPNWRKGLKTGLIAGAVAGLIFTVPYLFVFPGCVLWQDGHPSRDEYWQFMAQQRSQVEYWLSLLQMFTTFFVIVFLIGGLTSAFRPDRIRKKTK